MKSIFHLVCPNGLGHFKRTTEIWARLISEIEANVSIACEEWQYQRSATTAAVHFLNSSDKANFEFMDMKGALKWKDDPSQYNFGEYEKTLDTISGQHSFKNADMVLSDNLAGVVGKHSNVILLGSFMWHDVLESSFDHPPQGIARIEKRLLAEHQPICISVKEMTMPAVLSSTKNIGVNWFCDEPYDRHFNETGSSYNVLFSTGLSGVGNQRLEKLFFQLRDDEYFTIFGTPVFKERMALESDTSVGDFDFTDEAFKNIDLLIARPGIGSITEAIRFGIPIVAVDNGVNTEMLFNALRVEELGIGWNVINNDITIEEIKASYNRRLENIKNRPVNGFVQFREILNAHL